MKSLLTDPEELQVTHCNIRKEEEVDIVDLKVTTFVQIQQYYNIVTKSFSEICQIDNVIYHWRTNLQQLFLLPFQLWEKNELHPIANSEYDFNCDIKIWQIRFPSQQRRWTVYVPCWENFIERMECDRGDKSHWNIPVLQRRYSISYGLRVET